MTGAPEPTGESPRPGSATATIVYMLLGPILWALHFTFVYGAHTLRCTAAVVGTPVPVGGGALAAAIVAVTVAVVALLVGTVLRPEAAARALGVDRAGDRARFAARTMVVLAVLSALGIAWAGAAPLLLESCAAVR
jgi:hypothetical protein